LFPIVQIPDLIARPTIPIDQNANTLAYGHTTQAKSAAKSGGTPLLLKPPVISFHTDTRTARKTCLQASRAPEVFYKSV
jgi:hypothetical protein